MSHRFASMTLKFRRLSTATVLFLVVLTCTATVPAADSADSTQATIAPDLQKAWTEAPAAQRRGADQLWLFNKPEYHGTVLLTQTEIGSIPLASLIDKVLDQIDKQFSIRPEKAERQFAAANCMGFKVVYQATNRGSSRYQVQYFIPKNDHLYILTCSCKKGTELGIDFDGFADSFLPPARK